MEPQLWFISFMVNGKPQNRSARMEVMTYELYAKLPSEAAVIRWHSILS